MFMHHEFVHMTRNFVRAFVYWVYLCSYIYIFTFWCIHILMHHGFVHMTRNSVRAFVYIVHLYIYTHEFVHMTRIFRIFVHSAFIFIYLYIYIFMHHEFVHMMRWSRKLCNHEAFVCMKVEYYTRIWIYAIADFIW